MGILPILSSFLSLLYHSFQNKSRALAVFLALFHSFYSEFTKKHDSKMVRHASRKVGFVVSVCIIAQIAGLVNV